LLIVFPISGAGEHTQMLDGDQCCCPSRLFSLRPAATPFPLNGRPD
jgi:hypothetical protein